MGFSLTNSLIDLARLGILCLAWAAGGWLLVTHLFHLNPWERLLCGIATGWLVYVAAANLLAQLLPVTLAFWLASALVLLAGFATAWRSPVRPWLDLKNRSGWLQLATVVLITLVFNQILAGLAIFDDYVHLPLVSILATGDIPPHFYVDPSVYFGYHYALQLFSAVEVRVGGFFPWAAWKLARAFAIAMTLGLGWLFVRRLVRSKLAATAGSFIIAFGGGARWLLLFIPKKLMDAISASVQMTNTGLDTAYSLSKALISPWIITGGGPLRFPFAFHNGIFVPAFFALGSNGSFPCVVVLLMLLLTTRAAVSPAATVLLGLIFGILALSYETLFIPLWGGIALALLIYLALNRFRLAARIRARLWQWVGILGLGGVLSVFQGGYITEVVRSLLRLPGSNVAGNLYILSIRWPPSLPDAHMGLLSPLHPAQLVVLLAELGPALLLFPLVIWYTWRCIRRSDWPKAGLGIAGMVSFIFPLFFQVGWERWSTRLPASALWILLVLGFPLLVMVYRRARQALRVLLGTGYAVTVLGGVVILAIMLVAIQKPKASYFIANQDAMIARRYWNKLDRGAQVLDVFPERAVTVFGRASHARIDFYEMYVDFQALIANPDPRQAAQMGYSYIYIVRNWWDRLTIEQQRAFDQPCVHRLVTGNQRFDDSRRLYDIRQCKP